MTKQTNPDVINKFGILLKSTRTCFFYSDTIKAHVRIGLLDEEGRSQVEISPTLNLPRKETLRDESKYLLWHENEELRNMVGSSLYRILGDNITHYQKLILDKNGELSK